MLYFFRNQRLEWCQTNIQIHREISHINVKTRKYKKTVAIYHSYG
ncbi:hypothetical protein ETAE_1204 [Edwardsiella piscicida]|uniref:Uncharacterized protein n=1 Tax=Edwardsiella piscicida TaxID=1263550 RepID=A0AAU8P2F7_EDWPI|nr:hypothetical protein ETAE_1204 [Edwardsiella tarda EIB202]